MPELTFNIFRDEYERRLPQIELLEQILEAQGFSPPCGPGSGDLPSELAMETAVSTFGVRPVFATAKSWKKPLSRGRDLILCFVSLASPDPRSGKNLPDPPRIEFQIVVNPRF